MKINLQKTAKEGRGAPIANTNSVRHGLKSSKLPPRLLWAERRLNTFRKIIEDAVIAAKSEVSLVDAATINSAIRWERHAILAGHWLSKEMDKLNPDQRLKYSEAVAKASDARDRHIRLLGLDVEDSPWAAAFDGTIQGKGQK